MQTRKKKLLDQVRDKIRLKHYSLRTYTHVVAEMNKGRVVSPLDSI